MRETLLGIVYCIEVHISLLLSHSRSVSRLVGQSVGRSVSWSVSQSVGQSVSRSVGRSVSHCGGQMFAALKVTTRQCHSASSDAFITAQ